MERFSLGFFSLAAQKLKGCVKMLSPVTLATLILITCNKGGSQGGRADCNHNIAALVWQEHGLAFVWQTHSSYRAMNLVSLQYK